MSGNTRSSLVKAERKGAEIRPLLKVEALSLYAGGPKQFCLEVFNASSELFFFLMKAMQRSAAENPLWELALRAGAQIKGGPGLRDGWVLVQFENQAHAEDLVQQLTSVWDDNNRYRQFLEACQEDEQF
jgi:hypothetical protein